MNEMLSKRRRGASRQLIGELMRQGIEHPEVLSLAAGFVDSATLPVEPLQEITAELFNDPVATRVALQYDTPSGQIGLRASLRRYLADQDGVDESTVPPVERFVVTAGANQYLSLVCETLFDPGDYCLVAGPTYFVFLGTLHGVLAEPLWIDTDDEGMLPDSLDATLQRLNASGDLARVKAVYVVSDHDNPGGTFPTENRRRAILDVVHRWRTKQPILLIEDAAYRELNYGSRREPSFRQLDETGEAVVYTQTFSKSFSPGLRVGFGCGPKDLTAGIIDRKSNEDFGSPHLNQCLLVRAIENGVLRKHVRSLQDSYRIKRDAILDALTDCFADFEDVTWSAPEGGLYVWVTLPQCVDARLNGPLWDECVNSEHVMYVPGDLCYADTHGPTGVLTKPLNQLRLSFGVLDPALLAEGVARFARAVRKTIGQSVVTQEESAASTVIE